MSSKRLEMVCTSACSDFLAPTPRFQGPKASPQAVGTLLKALRALLEALLQLPHHTPRGLLQHRAELPEDVLLLFPEALLHLAQPSKTSSAPSRSSDILGTTKRPWKTSQKVTSPPRNATSEASLELAKSFFSCSSARSSERDSRLTSLASQNATKRPRRRLKMS